MRAGFLQSQSTGTNVDPPTVITKCYTDVTSPVDLTLKQTSNLSEAHETRDSLSSFFSQVVFVYRQPFLRNTLFMCSSQPKIAKKTKRKPPILGGRGSTSFNVIDIDTVKRFVTMISSMSASICKRFQATQANSNKITILGGYPSLTPACAALLEPKESKLAAIKSTLNAENFMCRWFWSKPISSHFGAVHS